MSSRLCSATGRPFVLRTVPPESPLCGMVGRRSESSIFSSAVIRKKRFLQPCAGNGHMGILTKAPPKQISVIKKTGTVRSLSSFAKFRWGDRLLGDAGRQEGRLGGSPVFFYLTSPTQIANLTLQLCRLPDHGQIEPSTNHHTRCRQRSLRLPGPKKKSRASDTCRHSAILLSGFVTTLSALRQTCATSRLPQLTQAFQEPIRPAPEPLEYRQSAQPIPRLPRRRRKWRQIRRRGTRRSPQLHLQH